MSGQTTNASRTKAAAVSAHPDGAPAQPRRGTALGRWLDYASFLVPLVVQLVLVLGVAMIVWKVWTPPAPPETRIAPAPPVQLTAAPEQTKFYEELLKKLDARTSENAAQNAKLAKSIDELRDKLKPVTAADLSQISEPLRELVKAAGSGTTVTPATPPETKLILFPRDQTRKAFYDRLLARMKDSKVKVLLAGTMKPIDVSGRLDEPDLVKLKGSAKEAWKHVAGELRQADGQRRCIVVTDTVASDLPAEAGGGAKAGAAVILLVPLKSAEPAAVDWLNFSAAQGASFEQVPVDFENGPQDKSLSNLVQLITRLAS
jgi:hypothetical protein